jgi:hypothetical protein
MEDRVRLSMTAERLFHRIGDASVARNRSEIVGSVATQREARVERSETLCRQALRLREVEFTKKIFGRVRRPQLYRQERKLGTPPSREASRRVLAHQGETNFTTSYIPLHPNPIPHTHNRQAQNHGRGHRRGRGAGAASTFSSDH